MAGMLTQTTLIRKASRIPSAHYWLTLLLLAALVPALRFAGLPIRFTWADYFQTFWVGIVWQSIFGGTILFIAGVPLADSLSPFFGRIFKEKLRIPLILVLAGVSILVLGSFVGLLLCAASIVVLEFKERAEENHIHLSKALLDIFWPAAYMFIGLLLLLAYNDVIASFRYDGTTDFALNRWDAVLLAGHSVSGLAHSFIGKWPGAVRWMEFIYFGMFAQIGGCMAIIALSEGRRRAMQFVGTILIAFYLALALFYLFPAVGPFGSCLNHFSRVPDGPMIYPIQQYVLSSLDRFRSGQTLSIIGYDYYIALPCMHLVQPLIVLWFMRRWKRMLVALIVFDFFLLPCILLLEQHYVVDLIAAVPVAAVAMALSARDVPILSADRSLWKLGADKNTNVTKKGLTTKSPNVA